MNIVEEGSLNSAHITDGARTARRVFQFRKRVNGEQLPSVPARFRSGPGSPNGQLIAIRLRPSTGEGWLRLRTSRLPRRGTIRTIPLNDSQSPAPTPDRLDLPGGAIVRCHDGSVGRLQGFTYDTRSGLVLDLLVHIREDVMRDVTNSRQPLAALLDAAGQGVLVSPAWAVSVTHEPASIPFTSGTSILLLNASAEQIASGTRIQSDGTVTARILQSWNENPALMPYISSITAVARDGEVTLSGTLPTRRQRATAEQDAWHVPGVLAVRNAITVRSEV